MKARPTILRKSGKRRLGRGFSKDELKKAGLSFTEALKLGISVDHMRRSTHDENVEAIKTFLSNVKTASKPKGKSKAEPPSSEASEA